MMFAQRPATGRVFVVGATALIVLSSVGCASARGDAPAPDPTVAESGTESAKSSTAPTSLPEVMPECPTSYKELPELTSDIAEGLVGTPMIWCDGSSPVASGAPVVVEPSLAVLAVDGVELPAEVEYEGRAVMCYPSDETFAVSLDGAWYSARKPECGEFL